MIASYRKKEEHEHHENGFEKLGHKKWLIGEDRETVWSN